MLQFSKCFKLGFCGCVRLSKLKVGRIINKRSQRIMAVAAGKMAFSSVFGRLGGTIYLRNSLKSSAPIR